MAILPQRYREKGCLAEHHATPARLAAMPILSSPSTLAAPEEEALSLRTDSLKKHTTLSPSSTICYDARCCPGDWQPLVTFFS